jgi:hypothetical protein
MWNQLFNSIFQNARSKQLNWFSIVINNAMRSIINKHKALNATSGGLLTYRPLPGPAVEYLDPFLFLNHHGTQVFPPANRGLPFGPHPHRGIETVTFILKGDLVHKDNAGFESRISAGGIQWMTAGSGLLHSETSSPDFIKNGGELNILQMWINLPAKLKMTKPHYVGLQKEDIPEIKIDEGKVMVHLIAGKWDKEVGPLQSITGVEMTTINFKEKGRLKVEVAKERTVFLYVVEGKLIVNGQSASERELVEFANDDQEINLEAVTEATIIFGHAKPYHEPVVAQGPFVMNTKEEIMQAYNDYNSGKFGSWDH